MRIETMNHSEAVKELAAERYLLDELSPGARDAFEEHMFDCPDCALDVRTGAIFIGEAKEQLPGLGSPAANIASGSRKESKQWFAWLRPAFAVPVMAALLVVVGYQNLVTLPALHNAADRPHVMQVVPLVGATRGGTHQTITADPANGISLPIDLSPDVAAGRSSFTFELTDPKGKSVSGKILPVNSDGAQSAGGDTQFSIVLPGHMLQNGAYMLVISGVDASGAWSPVARFAFDIALSK
jgi:hypothetical protein